MIPRYSRLQLRQIFSDEKRFDTWLRIELAACEAMEQVPGSYVPKGTAAALRKASAALTWDLGRLAEIESQTQHDVVAFLTYVEEQLGEKARFLHLGMTSSDVLDTSLALLLKEATEEILKGIDGKLLPSLQKKAELYRHTPLMGRSHGIHAEPIALGVVFASFYTEVRRAKKRIEQALATISVGKISGVVGVYGSGLLSPSVELQALSTLGLSPEPVSTQVLPRDRHAELFLAMALLGAAIERMALTIRHWQRTEVGEAEEAFGTKQKGSSAMPHKKNPVLSENLCGLARLLRSQAFASVENVALWHERDISHSSVERIIAPDIPMLADFMVHRAAHLIENLVVKPERMKQNLDRTSGLYCSEKVMLALITKGLSRQAAYEIVQRNALLALSEPDKKFQDLLSKDPDIQKHLSPKELSSCFELSHHLRHIDEIFARVFSNEDNS